MKLIRVGKEVSVKLTLPKDLHWKVFGSLLDDLWRKTEISSMTYQQTDASEELYARLKGIVRRRSVEDLVGIARELTPRCIVERVGEDKRNAFLFFVFYQAGAFLKKFPFRAKEAKEKAIAKFIQLEQSCALYNAENYRSILKLNDWHDDYLNVLEEMRADIAKVIGKCPPSDVFRDSRHGPGACVEVDSRGGEVTSFFKYANLPYGVTRSALPYAKEVIASDERWLGALDEWYRTRCENLYGPIDLGDFWSRVFRIVDLSRITTVPKTFEIDRSIAIEPRLNVFLQLGVDGFFRRMIRKMWGYDLDDQEMNQILAFIGSLYGGLATLDLAGASDTNTLRCCEILLPLAWYDLLLDLRCKAGTLPDGTPIVFEKISSMGNGYTFALETLVFGAAARAAIRRCKASGPSCVYGDDIIVPSEAYHYLVELLQYLGFSVNLDKSFVDGPFRESCGKDFFHGVAVRPVFLTQKLKTLSDLFYVHNVLYTLEGSLPWSWGLDFSTTRRLIRKYIPDNFREQFFGPPSESFDTYLFSRRKPQFTGREKDGRLFKCMYAIVPKAMDFERFGRGYRHFHFRKLMATLGARNKPEPWRSKRTLPAIGNVFKITKRSRVTLKCTRMRLLR